jgi:hypothetical protein
MSGSDVTVKSWKGDSTLVRARFGPGMLLQHEDLEYLGSYPRELSRLLFRSFFGCGVVCGLVVEEPVEKCGKVWLTVGPGLALGCSGDPIYVPKAQTFGFDEGCDLEVTTPLYVVLCPASKCCAPRAASCGDDDEEAPSVCTRERDGFEIRVVRERPPCACGCDIINSDTAQPHVGPVTGEPAAPRGDCRCVVPTDPCYVDHYEGKCGCHCGDCPDCECECVLLARLDKYENDLEHPWHADHRVRRFIRPVLMRDPQVAREVQTVAVRAAKKKEAEDVVRRELEKKLAEEAAHRDAEKKQAEEKARREEEEKKRAEAAARRAEEEKQKQAEEARREAEKIAAGEGAAREIARKPAARSRPRRTPK